VHKTAFEELNVENYARALRVPVKVLKIEEHFSKAGKFNQAAMRKALNNRKLCNKWAIGVQATSDV
jgi:hypothetical protein